MRYKHPLIQCCLILVCCSAPYTSADEDQGSPSPCLSQSATLGDSAYWATEAVTQYANQDFIGAVQTVDACFDIWAPEAGQAQKSMFDEGVKCPRTGRVSKKTKAKIQENYLMNDVSMALWAKARSLHELGDLEQAKAAYGQCVHMACGRAWDPKGWFWSPAEDCATFARKLLNDDAS
jgi:hypothetical protein